MPRKHQSPRPAMCEVKDEEDDLVLATAVAARADYLVTGDRYLLEIGAFRGIPIVTPRAFLDVLAEDAG